MGGDGVGVGEFEVQQAFQCGGENSQVQGDVPVPSSDADVVGWCP